MKTANYNCEPKRKPRGHTRPEAILPHTSAVKRVLDCAHGCTPSVTQMTHATAEAGSKKARSYRRLPKEFRHDGFQYRQIAREGDAAIYEQTRNTSSNASIAYEVIRIRRRDFGFAADLSKRRRFIQIRKLGARTVSHSPTEMQPLGSSTSWYEARTGVRSAAQTPY